MEPVMCANDCGFVASATTGYCAECSATMVRKMGLFHGTPRLSPPEPVAPPPPPADSWRSALIDAPRAAVRSLPPLAAGDAVLVNGATFGAVTEVRWQATTAGVPYQMVTVQPTGDTLATVATFLARGLAVRGAGEAAPSVNLVYGRPLPVAGGPRDDDMGGSAGAGVGRPTRTVSRPPAGGDMGSVPGVQLAPAVMDGIRAALSAVPKRGAGEPDAAVDSGGGGGAASPPRVTLPAPPTAGTGWLPSSAWLPTAPTVGASTLRIVRWVPSTPAVPGGGGTGDAAPIRERSWPPFLVPGADRVAEAAERSPTAPPPIAELRDEDVTAAFGHAWLPLSALKIQRSVTSGDDAAAVQDGHLMLLLRTASRVDSLGELVGDTSAGAPAPAPPPARDPPLAHAFVGLPDSGHSWQALPVWLGGYGDGDALVPVRPLAQTAALGVRVVEAAGLDALVPPSLFPAVEARVATVVTVTVAGKTMVTAPRVTSVAGAAANPVWWHPRRGCDDAAYLDALTADRNTAPAGEVRQGRPAARPARLSATGGTVMVPLRRPGAGGGGVAGGALTACSHAAEDEVVDVPLVGIHCCCQFAWHLAVYRRDDPVSVAVWAMPPAEVEPFCTAVRAGRAITAAAPSARLLGEGDVTLRDARVDDATSTAATAAPPAAAPAAEAADGEAMSDADRDALTLAVGEYMRAQHDAKRRLATLSPAAAITTMLTGSHMEHGIYATALTRLHAGAIAGAEDAAMLAAWRAGALAVLAAREHADAVGHVTGSANPAAPAVDGTAAPAGTAPAASSHTELAEAITAGGLMLQRDVAFMGLSQADVVARLQAEGFARHDDTSNLWVTPPPWRAGTPWNPATTTPGQAISVAATPPLLDPDIVDLWVPLSRASDGRPVQAAVRLHLRLVRNADVTSHVGTGPARRPLMAWLAASGFHSLIPLAHGLAHRDERHRHAPVDMSNSVWGLGVGSDGLTAVDIACTGSTNDHHRALQVAVRMMPGSGHLHAASQPLLGALLTSRAILATVGASAPVQARVKAAHAASLLLPSRTTTHCAVLGGNWQTVKHVAQWHVDPAAWRDVDSSGLDPLALAVKLGRVRVASWVLGEAAWSSSVADRATGWMAGLRDTWKVCAVYAGEAADRAVFRALVEEVTALQATVSPAELSKLCARTWDDWIHGRRVPAEAAEFQLGQARVRNDRTWRLGPAPLLHRCDAHGTPLLFHLVASLQPTALAWWLQMGGSTRATTDAWGVREDTALHVAVRAAIATLPAVPPCDDAALRRFALVLGLLKAAGAPVGALNAAGQTAVHVAAAARHMTSLVVLALVFTEADRISGTVPVSGVADTALSGATAAPQPAYSLPSLGLAGVVARFILSLTGPFTASSVEARTDPGAAVSGAATSALSPATTDTRIAPFAGLSPLSAWAACQLAGTRMEGPHAGRLVVPSAAPLLAGVDAGTPPLVSRLMAGTVAPSPPVAGRPIPSASGLPYIPPLGEATGTSASGAATVDAAGVGLVERLGAPSRSAGVLEATPALDLSAVDASDGVYTVPDVLSTLRRAPGGVAPASDAGFTGDRADGAAGAGAGAGAVVDAGGGDVAGAEESKEDGGAAAGAVAVGRNDDDNLVDESAEAPLSAVLQRVHRLAAAVQRWPDPAGVDALGTLTCPGCGHECPAVQLWLLCPNCRTLDTSDARRGLWRDVAARIPGVIVVESTDVAGLTHTTPGTAAMINTACARRGLAMGVDAPPAAAGAGVGLQSAASAAASALAPLPPRHASTARADWAFAPVVLGRLGDSLAAAHRGRSHVVCSSAHAIDEARRDETWRFAVTLARACGVPIPADAHAAARHLSRLSYHLLAHAGDVNDAAEAVVSEAAAGTGTVPPPPDSPDEEEMCPACMDDLPARDMLALPCGHRFCVQCWGGALDAAVNGVGSGCITSTVCMAAPECTCPVDEWMWLAAATPTVLARYSKWVTDAYIARQPHLRRCTNPANCGRVFDVSGLPSTPPLSPAAPAWAALLAATEDDGAGKGRDRVHALADAARALVEPLTQLTSPTTGQPLALTLLCDCGFLSCSHCDLGGHAPATCDAVAVYRNTTSRMSDSASLAHMTSSYKRCPQCNVFISKNGGCRHMSCSSCHHQFCWFCGSQWDGYGHRCPYWGRTPFRSPAARPAVTPGPAAPSPAADGRPSGASADAAEVVTVLPRGTWASALARDDITMRAVQQVSARVGVLATAQTQVVKRLLAFGGAAGRARAVATILASGGAGAQLPAVLPGAPMSEVIVGRATSQLAHLAAAAMDGETFDAHARSMAVLYSAMAHRGLVELERSRAQNRSHIRPVPRRVEVAAPALLTYTLNNGRRCTTEAYSTWGVLYVALLHTSQWLVASQDAPWLAALEAGHEGPLLQSDLPPLLRASASSAAGAPAPVQSSPRVRESVGLVSPAAAPGGDALPHLRSEISIPRSPMDWLESNAASAPQDGPLVTWSLPPESPVGGAGAGGVTPASGPRPMAPDVVYAGHDRVLLPLWALNSTAALVYLRMRCTAASAWTSTTTPLMNQMSAWMQTAVASGVCTSMLGSRNVVSQPWFVCGTCMHAMAELNAGCCHDCGGEGGGVTGGGGAPSSLPGGHMDARWRDGGRRFPGARAPPPPPAARPTTAGGQAGGVLPPWTDTAHGCCLSCALNCHGGHQLVYMGLHNGSCSCPRGMLAGTAVVSCSTHQQWRSASDVHRSGFAFATDANRVTRRIKSLVGAVGGCLGVAAPLLAYLRLGEVQGQANPRVWNPAAYCTPRNLASAALFTTDSIRDVYRVVVTEAALKQQESLRASSALTRDAARATGWLAQRLVPTPSSPPSSPAVAARPHPTSTAALEHLHPVPVGAIARQAQVLACLTILHSLLSFLQWVHVRRIFPLSTDGPRAALLSHQTDLLQHEVETLFSLLCSEPAPPPSAVDAKAALAHTAAALRLCSAWMR